MEEELSLGELFDIFRDNLGKIIGASALGLIIAFIYTLFLTTPMYQSQSQLLVNRPSSENVIQQTEINANIQLINTYEDIILNPIILEPVIEELNTNYTIEELREMITINSDETSQVFSVSVQNEHPVEAANIANTISQVFSEELPEIMDIDNVSIISQATPDDDAVSPNMMLNLLIGLVLGFLVGTSYALFKALTDTKVSSEDSVKELTGWGSLGTVSIIEEEDLISQETHY